MVTLKQLEVSLKEYMDARFAALEDRMQTAEKRIESLEQNKLNVGAHDALEVRIQVLEKAQARTGQQRLSASQIAIIAASIALASLAMNLTTVLLLVNHLVRM